MHRPNPPQQGYTLIEMIIALVAFGVMAAALVPVALNSLRAHDVARQQAASLDALRYAVDRIARELREVSYLPATQRYDFLAMQSQAVRFRRPFSQQNAAGTVTTGVDEVSISLSGTSLLLNYASLNLSPTPVLMDRVSGFSLHYLDAAGATAATDATVVAVRIVVSALDPSGRSYSHRTTVELRNREVM